MNIRTVTYFVDTGYPISESRLNAAGTILAEVRSALQGTGYMVQTVRLACPPFSRLIADPAEVVRFALDLEAACFVHKIDYATIGPARPTDAQAYYDAIPEALGQTQNIFAAALTAEATSGLSLPAVRRAAGVIHRCASLAADGFANLRFSALANVPPGSPFFPAAFHDGGTPMIAVGVEAADLAVTACDGAGTLAEARARLIRGVEDHAGQIARIAKRAGGARGLRFGGIDFTLAPYPEATRSLGTALELLSGNKAGEPGTLSAAAFLADALNRARFPAAGFSGLFFPVFEDAVLAERAAEGVLSVTDLLLYATVCGAGLDTVPLPGDMSPSAIAVLLADVAALALRLDKPLTARLMPIPGKRAGDPVDFDFPYFAPTRVLDPGTAVLGGLLAGDENFDLAPRSR